MTDYTDIHSRSLAAVETLMSQAAEIIEQGAEFEDDEPFSTAALQDLDDAIESIAIDTLDIATSGLAQTVNDPETFSHVQMMVEYWEQALRDARALPLTSTYAIV